MKTKTYVKGVAALCALAAVACTGVQQSRGDVAVYLDESQPLEKRVEDALSRMTLEEKVGLLPLLDWHLQYIELPHRLQYTNASLRHFQVSLPG